MLASLAERTLRTGTRRKKRESYYSNKQVAASIIMQLIFEQRDLGIKENRIRSCEFGHWNGLLRVLWICGGPRGNASRV
jgi:hypothetical protein